MARLLSLRSAKAPSAPDIARPDLDLSAEALREALSVLVTGAEEQGGIERFVQAMTLKSQLFKEVFSGGRPSMEGFLNASTFMPTVRRRLVPYLDAKGFERISQALKALLDGIQPGNCDQRIDEFCARFPQNGEHRFVRDLAAEVLHNLDPERFPLMTRWVWDRKSNTGVLREIWFAEDVDCITIEVEDGYGTFLMLREELAQFLTANGIYRDLPAYVDLLCAQVYAQYICTRGGTYLRAEFAAPEDPMEHVRRLLGLDGVNAGSSRTRLKAIDGTAYRIADPKAIG